MSYRIKDVLYHGTSIKFVLTQTSQMEKRSCCDRDAIWKNSARSVPDLNKYERSVVFSRQVLSANQESKQATNRGYCCLLSLGPNRNFEEVLRAIIRKWTQTRTQHNNTMVKNILRANYYTCVAMKRPITMAASANFGCFSASLISSTF